MKLFLFFILVTCFCKSPNIVVFLIDDLGYGDLGCFGNTTCPTPNIDKMSQEGILFTQMLAAGKII